MKTGNLLKKIDQMKMSSQYYINNEKKSEKIIFVHFCSFIMNTLALNCVVTICSQTLSNLILDNY